jgi:ribose/xylose/arabinose/galactoside ABC-type transport system permease subunit
VGIVTASVVALFAGTIIAKARIPAFIVTMGTMSIGRGLALIYAHGMPVANFPDSFNYLGTESLGPVPWPVVIYVLVILIAWYILNKRPLGRYIYAVGANEEAARAAGFDIEGPEFWLNGVKSIEALVGKFEGMAARAAALPAC